MSRSVGSPDEKPLQDIVVIDLTTFVTGGFATMMLANQGAEVIKVERPGRGDDSRYSGPPFMRVDGSYGSGRPAADEGESPYFWTVNYGKRSIELDLKSQKGREVLYTLVSEADVFIENYRPGTAKRLQVDDTIIREYNDNIVYCSISAFGETGPWSDRPGYDLLIQGLSGIMSVTGYADRDPVKIGIPQTDLITGMWAAFGIVNALYRRERTGEGDRIELGMLDATLPWLTKQAGRVFLNEETERLGNKDPVLAPYQTFSTADGLLNVACGNQRLWEALCEALNREDLVSRGEFKTNSARVEHQEELEAELEAVFKKRTTSEWVDQLANQEGLPVAPILTVEEALSNEQIIARGVVRTVKHPVLGEIPIIEHPLNYDNADAGFDGPPPLLGEDTESILRKLGYEDNKIRVLREEGVIGN